MSRLRGERVSTAVLLSYLDDELSADEAAAIERVALESESVRQQLDGLRTLRRGLQAPVPALESRQIAWDRPAAPARPSPGRVFGRSLPPAALAFAAVATLLVGVGIGQLLPRPEEMPSSEAPEVRAKSGASAASAARWAGIVPYRLGKGDDRPERVRKSVRQEDGLSFSYTNLGGEPFARLLIFCVDAQRELHWFYPEYATPSDNPSSIAIEAGQDVPLSQVIWLELPKGGLTLYAAFTRGPLDVWSVERWFADHPEGGAGFAGPDAVVRQFALTVE